MKPKRHLIISAPQNLAPSFFELVAHKLQQRPETIQRAIENCRRWQQDGHSSPHRLAEWERALIAATAGSAGMERLLQLLLADDPKSKRLRDFHPFAGILTREERRRARELCGYRH